VKNAKEKPLELREACLQAAREVIAESGVEGLSMRDVARKLGISHQAPYRHFPSRDHLLAEIMRRCFADFARHLDERQHDPDPDADLGALGTAYLSYAAKMPLEYRLMFGTPWPEPARHPELVTHAVHAFDILRGCLRRKYGAQASLAAKIDLDAMFIWSTLHGMASITQANVMQHLALAPTVGKRFQEDLMQKIGVALGVPASLAAPPSAKKRKVTRK
jgi:AcrR family transcriptional regulator